jgi:Sec-independent protein translocase protein TatA
MRFGVLELGIIVAIILIIYGVNRLRKVGQNSGPRVYEREEEPVIKTRSVTRRVTQEEADENIKRNRSARARILGFILICVGILIALYGLFVLRWVAMSSMWLWAVVLVAIGLATVFISRRR